MSEQETAARKRVGYGISGLGVAAAIAAVVLGFMAVWAHGDTAGRLAGSAFISLFVGGFLVLIGAAVSDV